MKKGYTLIEILITLTIVSILTVLAGLNIKRVKYSHMADTIVQEFLILRNAFNTYREIHGGKISTVVLTNLENSKFDNYRSHWQPFIPSHSNVIKDAQWYACLDGDNSYLQLRTNGECVKFDNKTTSNINEKLHGVCTVYSSTTEHRLYIFK